MREHVARRLPQATRIAHESGAPIDFRLLRLPINGSPILSTNVFQAILEGPSYGGVSREQVTDLLNQTLGLLEERVRREMRRLLNPVTWLSESLGLPFRLLQMTGFDARKIEDQLVGRLFKLAELGAILGLLTWLAPKPELRELLLKIITAK
jgi:hypothetical protein